MLRVNALIVGAGVIGSSVAYHLARLGMTDIRVIDLDLEGSLSSSELNAGGVRATFAQPINIEMSKLTIEYLAKHKPETGYRDVGYVWLKTPEMMAGAKAAQELQKRHGWEVQSWDVTRLRNKLPFIDKTDDLAGALFAPRDGLVNPNLVKNFYRTEARKLGVVFDDGTLIQDSEEVSETELQVRCLRFRGLSQETKIALYSGERSNGEVVAYRTGAVINCAGAWADPVARALSYESPATAVRRQVSIFDCRDVDLSRYGMIVDTSGVYFHPEAMNGLAGFAVKGEPAGVNFEYQGETFFNEYIWPALYERASGFERLKHLTGWSGLYDVSPDESAIIGRAVRGKRSKFREVFEAHSFSGHGVMHCHAAGIALAELIAQRKYSTVDATQLSAERFADGKLLYESAVI